jgi:hypothetical protein
LTHCARALRNRPPGSFSSSNSKPADPAAFLTAIPIWREGDAFLAGRDLQRFRILEIAPADKSDLLARDFDAAWMVETAGA